jgi:dTDP-4-dehydrorhamnose reductase
MGIKYLIFGANGQLAREFISYFNSKNKTYLALNRKKCDITNFNTVSKVISEYQPDIIINCAAYNQVDKAEKDYTAAIKTNSIGIQNIAYAASKYRSIIVHYSTDYVFNGKKEDGLYAENDKPDPINEYGKSKLIGEQLLQEISDKFLIFRVSWVYGKGKQNFIYKFLSWARHNKILHVSYNEISIPTSTRLIVELTIKAIHSELKGLFHLTNTGYASRYEWAREITDLKKLDLLVKPVDKTVFNLPAQRPDFSAMSNEKLSKTLSINIPHWKEELKYFLKKLGE